MGVTSTRVGGARAATGVRATTIGIGSQDHEMTRRTDIVATGRNGLEIGARIPERDAIGIEGVSEGAQVPTATMQGPHGESHRTHHYHIALVLPSRRLYLYDCRHMLCRCLSTVVLYLKFSSTTTKLSSWLSQALRSNQQPPSYHLKLQFYSLTSPCRFKAFGDYLRQTRQSTLLFKAFSSGPGHNHLDLQPPQTG